MKYLMDSKFINNLLKISLQFALLIILIVAFVPLSPKLPTGGLDASWALALNQAVGQGLAFGKDIIFTLGPYASMYTKSYHPATAGMMLAGCLYLAISYWICLLFFMKTTDWRWSIAFGLVLVGLLCSRDALFFSYALVAGLASCRFSYVPRIVCGINETKRSKSDFVMLVLFLAPLGLLALVKGTLLVLSASILLLCWFFFLTNKQYAFAWMSVLTVFTAMVLFWKASGQAVFNLPAYLINSVYIAYGFTQAMSSHTETFEICLYLFNSLLIVLVLATAREEKNKPSSLKWIVLGCYCLFLFVSFKSGFTRHYGHVFIAATSLVLAAFLLPFCIKSKAIIPVLFISLGVSHYIENRNGATSVVINARTSYSTFWHGLSSWLQDTNWLQKDYQLAMNFLQQQTQFPVAPGFTDIYSNNQTYLLASGNHWHPRPIFQSYSVFNARLAEKNRQHLLTQNRPDTIFFKLEAIDGRIPALEDGASWPALLTHYQLQQNLEQFIVLKKNMQSHVNNALLTPLTWEQHTLGEKIILPRTNQKLFVQMNIKPTLLGRISTFLLAPEQLFIHLELPNGNKKSYRLIANMAQAGFLLSPLVESTEEFARLYEEQNLLDDKNPLSFSVTSSNPSSWQWQRKYNVEFSVIK